jgi:SAM-dependent methyltransferase
MSVNYEYSVQLMKDMLGSTGRVLDYGCGGGEIIGKALAAGFDIWGVDKYAPDWNALLAKPDESIRSRIQNLANDDNIPFPDQSFDMVVSNMVFEHIEDFSQPLREIRRVLKPEGSACLIFPTSEVWLEMHAGLPLAHRFGHGSAWRKAYMTACHRIGLGRSRGNVSTSEWVADMERVLDEMTFYKPVDKVRNAVEASGLRYGKTKEADHVGFRLSKIMKSDLPRKITTSSALEPLFNFLGSRILFRVIVLSKA